MTLRDYRLGERLGAGTSGQVVAAVHVPTGLSVAIKQVLCEDFRDRARVAFEVAAMARMSHRHVIPVYESGTDGTTAWFVMERAAGRWGERALTGQHLVVACREVLLGLAHAHSRDVLHRDLKPENLLISASGVVRIADFGIASVAGGQRLAGAGTPKFMAPEQRHAGLDEGPWTDLYALGKVVLDGLSDDESALGEWARWLCAPQPGQRPHCAAAALDQLPESGLSEWRRETHSAPTERTQDAVTSGALAAPMLAGWSAPAIPNRWREAPAAPPMVDGVWRLRSSPGLVGRTALQERLWACATGDGEGDVALQGEPGVGVGALLDWLATHASEVGIPVLRVRSDSLRDVLLQWLGGRPERELVSQALYRLGADVAVAGDLADLASTGTCAGDRVRAVAAWLTAQVGRPLVVIDDVDVHSEPVSLLLGMRRAGVDMRLVSRCPLPDVVTVEVPALPSHHIHQALAQIAPLTPHLQTLLVERFGADLAAMQDALIQWADDDWLVRTPVGLGVSERGVPMVVRPPLSASERRLAALFAASGGRSTDVEWDALCLECGVDAAGITAIPWVDRVPNGWAVRGGRYLTKLTAALSQTDAVAVVDRLSADVPDDAIRGAIVLWDAGLCDRAMSLLLRTIRECNLSPPVAVAQCERLLQWMSEDDVRRLDVCVLYAGRLTDSGRLKDAVAVAESVEQSDLTPGQRFSVAHARYTAAVVSGSPQEALEVSVQTRLPSEHPRYLRWLSDHCIALFSLGRFGDVETMASSVPDHAHHELWRVRGEAALYRGDIDLAERCMEGAIAGGNSPSLAYALQLRAACLQQRGDLAGAEAGCLQAAEAGLGRQDGLQAMTNAALIAALRGRDVVARSRAEQVLPRLRRLGWKQNEAYALAVLWATTSDPVLAERHGQQARVLIDELGLPDPDLDALAKRAVETATAQGLGVTDAHQWLAGRGAS